MTCINCSNLKIMDKRCASELEPYHCLKYKKELDHRYTDEEFPEIEPCEECKQSEQELKPCPFCGAQAVWYDEYLDLGFYQIGCPNFDCHVATNLHAKRENAIAAWNRRVER